MWIGLLTEGAHPGRPPACDTLATLFAWGPQERLRIDGPQAAIHAGIRQVRRELPAAVGVPHAPRCFACRTAYPLPFPDVIRARQDIPDVGAGFPDGVTAPADGGGDRSPAVNAVFLLVHIDDAAPANDEGEALVVVGGSELALLVPFDGLPIVAGVLGEAFSDQPIPACAHCGGPAPGGTLGEPSRAARRRSARGARGGRRAA